MTAVVDPDLAAMPAPPPGETPLGNSGPQTTVRGRQLRSVTSHLRETAAPLPASLIPTCRLVGVAEDCEPSLKPLFEAMLEAGCYPALVTRETGAFDFPMLPPFTVLLHDAEGGSGPSAFDGPSVDRLVRAASGVIIVTTDPQAGVSIVSAKLAEFGCSGLIIQTSRSRGSAWRRLVRRVAPMTPILGATRNGFRTW